MGAREYEIMRGAVEGLNTASSNLMNLTLAKHKLKQEKELFDITKKQKGLEIQKLELDPNLDPDFVEGTKKAQMAEDKFKTAEFDYKFSLLEDTEKVTRQELKNKQQEANIASDLYSQISSGEIPSGRISLKDGKVGIADTSTKEVSYSKQFDEDFNSAVSLVLENPDRADEIKASLQKAHPRRWSINHEINFDDIVEQTRKEKRQTKGQANEPGFFSEMITKGAEFLTGKQKGGANKARNTAIDKLKSKGYPVTKANITALMGQIEEEE